MDQRSKLVNISFFKVEIVVFQYQNCDFKFDFGSLKVKIGQYLVLQGQKFSKFSSLSKFWFFDAEIVILSFILAVKRSKVINILVIRSKLVIFCFFNAIIVILSLILVVKRPK